MVVVDDGDVVVEGVHVVAAVHLDIGGGDPGASGEDVSCAKSEGELTSLGSPGPPAMSGGHGAGVGQ